MLEESAVRNQPIGIHFLRGLTLVRLYGALTAENLSDVQQLASGLAAARQPVVVNVAAVTEMNTEGLRWLMQLTRQVRGQGDYLILESPTLCVEQVLTLTGCHSWFSAATRPGPDGRTDTARLIKDLSA